jgi:hypothetical protein
MKVRTRRVAWIAAAAWLAAGCTEQNREQSAERARSGEDRNVHGAPSTAGGAAAGGTAAGATGAARATDTDEGKAGSATQSAPAAAAEKTVTGTVVRASQDELVLKQAGGDDELKLKVGAQTTVMMAGREAPVSALKEGTEVRASYDESQNATRIEAQGPPSSTSTQTGPPGAPGSSGTDTPATSPSGSGTSSAGAPGTTGPSTSETPQQR